MRKVGRLSRMLALFYQLWVKMPDMRFFQMVDYIKQETDSGNQFYYYPPSYSLGDIENGQGSLVEGIDPYHIEDDVLENTLRRLIDETP